MIRRSSLMRSSHGHKSRRPWTPRLDGCKIATTDLGRELMWASTFFPREDCAFHRFQEISLCDGQVLLPCDTAGHRLCAGIRRATWCTELDDWTRPNPTGSALHPDAERGAAAEADSVRRESRKTRYAMRAGGPIRGRPSGSHTQTWQWE